jgi:hypothetical protein
MSHAFILIHKITLIDVSHSEIIFILLSLPRSGGPGSIPGTTRKKKVVGLERGALSLVSTTEELLERKNSGSCL